MAVKKNIPVFAAVATGAVIGFIEAVFTLYERRLLPINEWNSSVHDLNTLTAALVKNQLLWTMQSTELCMLLLTAIFAVAIGRTSRDKTVFFMLLLGASKIVHYLCLFFMIGWPRSLAEGDIIFVCPSPWIAPVYVSLTIWFLMIAISVFIYFSPERADTHLSVQSMPSENNSGRRPLPAENQITSLKKKASASGRSVKQPSEKRKRQK